MKHISTILFCAGLVPGALQAQEQPKDSTLNRTVTVENQYNPQVMDAFKINVLPKVEEPAVEKKNIDYAVGARPLTRWQAEPMKAVSEQETPLKAPRGYVRAAYGNRHNTDIKAAYLWDITRRDRLDVMASFYGMNGDVFHPAGEGTPDWGARFFRTDASLGYRHQFDKVALSVGGAFASQVFSYMPGDDLGTDFIGRQHYTLGEAFAGVASVAEDLPVQFSFQTGFRSFNRKYAVPYLESGAETVVHTLGEISGTVNETQRVGISFTMDNVLYGSNLNNYTLLQLNPYYTLQNEDFRLRLGAHVDWQMSNGGGLKVSPDVELDYTFADSYVLYAQAGGGTVLNDFRRLNEVSPFWASLKQMTSTYTPLDVQAGLKASPWAGLGFRLYGGYRMVKNEVFLGLWQPEPLSNSVYAGLAQAKANVGYAGAAVEYGYKDRVDVSLSGTYQSWSMDDELKPLLWLKPELSFNFSARAKVFADFSLSAAYRYESRVKVGNLQTDAVNDLSLSAGYEFFRRLNVFVGFHNLLNQKYLMENAYPVQGFHVLAGASIRF